MPMKRTSTPILGQSKTKQSTNKKEKSLHPRSETIHFLKLFARNYQVETGMPEGLQGVFLG